MWSQIVPTYLHTDDKHKGKTTNKVDKQYEDNNIPPTNNNYTVKSGDII